MISIAICDDSNYFIQEFKNYIEQFKKEKNINLVAECFSSGEEVLQTYCHQFNIIFLDIKMKVINGIEVAKAIRKIDTEVIIVFVTSVFDYISVGYALDASNYMMKPIQYCSFCQEMDRLLVKCKRQTDGFVIVENDLGNYKLYFNNIKYLETYKHNILFQLDDNTSVMCYDTMKVMEQKLGKYFFSRCHSSYLVNLRYVNNYSSYEITLKTGEKIPVSQKKKAAFMKELANYFERNKM